MADMMTKELDELLGISRRKLHAERHVTSRITTGNIIPEVARGVGVPQHVAKAIIHEFLQVVFERLVDHSAVSLKNIGTFYFIKAAGRKVAKKRKGSDKRDVVDIPPRCRLRFRATAKLKDKSGWYPRKDLVEETKGEEERQKRLEEYLKEKSESSSVR